MIKGVPSVGGAEWILDATISGGSFSCSWDYDADTIIIMVTQNGGQTVIMYDVATNGIWYAQVNANWNNAGTDSRVTITPRSISGTYSGETLTNMSIIPIKGKPTGYFS